MILASQYVYVYMYIHTYKCKHHTFFHSDNSTTRTWFSHLLLLESVMWGTGTSLTPFLPLPQECGWSVEDGRDGKGDLRMSLKFPKIFLCMFLVDNNDVCERWGWVLGHVVTPLFADILLSFYLLLWFQKTIIIRFLVHWSCIRWHNS